MSARTGGMKGALATHSWIVLKRQGEARYERYDKVGWGQPVRRNAFVADGNWYSNPPKIIWQAEGPLAASAPARHRRCDRRLPLPEHRRLRHLARAELELVHRPCRAVRSGLRRRICRPKRWAGIFPRTTAWMWRDAAGTWRASLGGYAGLSIGGTAGFEMNFLGLVSGFDWRRGEIKLPGFGSVRLT